MSGPIRQLIGPARTRLKRYLEEAATLLSTEVEEKTLEDDKLRVEETIARISNSSSLLERCNRDWSEVLKDLKGEEKTKEEKKLHELADGHEGYVELLLDAGETVVFLQTRLKVISREQERVHQTKLTGDVDDRLSSTLNKHSGTKHENVVTENTSLKVNLSKLHLPFFDGDIEHWPEFWDIFKATIHEQNIPSVSKFSYLKSVLRGSALSSIAGIPLISENYSMAIKLLQNRFGRKETIIDSLYAKLQNIPRVVNHKFFEVQKVSETIERLLRQLEAQGEIINDQRTLVQQIISKFPTEVITRLEDYKQPAVPWNMKSLREAICQYVTIQENVQRYVYNTNLYVKGQQFVSKHVTGSHKSFGASSDVSHRSDVLTANLQRRRSFAEPTLPCIFCKGGHFNDKCDRYGSLSERKQRLAQQKRCFICLKVGHMCKDCPSSLLKSCYYCGKGNSHNRCICPQKFGTSDVNVIVPELPVNIKEESVKPSNIDQLAVSNSLTTTTPSLLASGERVLLQTATVLVQPPDGMASATARVLLDSASQRTFMTNNLAKQLNLRSEHQELLSVSTFGASKATDLSTYVV